MFWEELISVLPRDDDAARLKANSYHFAEFADVHDVEVPAASGARWCGRTVTARPVVRTRICGCCSEWGCTPKRSPAVAAESPAAGVRERGKYDIAVDCGEQSLLLAMREAGAGTAVVANGFSCRSQITQVTARKSPLHAAHALHLAEHGQRIDGGDGSVRPLGRTGCGEHAASPRWPPR